MPRQLTIGRVMAVIASIALALAILKSMDFESLYVLITGLLLLILGIGVVVALSLLLDRT